MAFSDDYFFVIPTFEVKEDKIDDFRAMLHKEGPAIYGEPGLLRWDTFRQPGTNKFHAFEIYENQAAFVHHTKQPGFPVLQGFGATGLAAPPTLRRGFKPVSIQRSTRRGGNPDDFVIQLLSLTVREECHEEFVTEASKLYDAMRDEETTIRFDVLQSGTNPREYWMYEVYSSKAGHAEHLKLPTVNKFFGLAATMLEAPPVVLAGENVMFTPNRPKLEYFPAHGRGLQCRLIFDFTKTNFEDYTVEFAEFMKKKMSGYYPQGQVPVLHLADGTIMNQTQALMRYLGKTLKGPAGEALYPSEQNDAAYDIDMRIRKENDNYGAYTPFFYQLDPRYAQKDEHFQKYITGPFQAYLQDFEDTLTKSGTKYLVGNHQTLADICSAGMLFLKIVYNPKFEHNLIMAAIVSKYPKTQAWADNQKQIYATWLLKDSYPF